MKRVFPERQWVELEMDHPIFHSVYDLKGPKEKLQVPNVMIGRRAEMDKVLRGNSTKVSNARTSIIEPFSMIKTDSW